MAGSRSLGATPRREPFGFGAVMHCDEVRQLFDAYLDGDLSPSQATELGAHRLHCADCRRALALLEVSGHIIASDADSVDLPADFTDRLLACVADSEPRWIHRLRRIVYIGAPTAAAAVIALAFLGVFNRPGPGDTRVLGERAVNMDATPARGSTPQPAPGRMRIDPDVIQRRNEQRLRDLRANVDAVEQLNLTVLQWMEYLKDLQELQATETQELGPEPSEALDPLKPKPAQAAPEGDSAVEDL